MANNASLEQRAQFYIKRARKGETDCINSRIKYELERADPQNSALTLKFDIEDWQMNPGGVLHGGMMSTLLDITMGITTLSLTGFYCATVNMSVSFLEPVESGDTLLVTARATRVGRHFVQLVGEAYSQSLGRAAATSTGVFVLTGEKIAIPEENNNYYQFPLAKGIE